MKNRIASAGFEAAAISAAIDMESRAIELYSASSEKLQILMKRNFFTGWLNGKEATISCFLNWTGISGTEYGMITGSGRFNHHQLQTLLPALPVNRQ
jgi:hypothetical protein